VIEVRDHPTDARRVIVRMTGGEHMFLNLTRNDARELRRSLAVLGDEPVSEPVSA
jgi:hypothetical protein